MAKFILQRWGGWNGSAAAAPPSAAMNVRLLIHPSRSSEIRLAPFRVSGSGFQGREASAGNPASSLYLPFFQPSGSNGQFAAQNSEAAHVSVGPILLQKSVADFFG